MVENKILNVGRASLEIEVHALCLLAGARLPSREYRRNVANESEFESECRDCTVTSLAFYILQNSTCHII